MKAGKMAATAIGGTLLLLQIAHHKGYIKVNTRRFLQVNLLDHVYEVLVLLKT